jgi:hypothetical protein
MTAAGTRAVVLAALLAGGVVCALALTSDHVDHKAVAAVFEPAVGWCFIGTGLYAWRTRPVSRTGALMVAMGFAWLPGSGAGPQPRDCRLRHLPAGVRPVAAVLRPA